MLVQELVEKLEKASKELSDLEGIKNSIKGDIDSLVKQRESLIEKNKAFQKEYDFKVKEVKTAKSDLEKRIDLKNQVLNDREAKLNIRSAELDKKEVALQEKDKVISDKSDKVDNFLKEYKEGLLGKSEEFKKLAEKLKE